MKFLDIWEEKSGKGELKNPSGLNRVNELTLTTALVTTTEGINLPDRTSSCHSADISHNLLIRHCSRGQYHIGAHFRGLPNKALGTRKSAMLLTNITNKLNLQ